MPDITDKIKEIDVRLKTLINNCQKHPLREVMSYSLFSGGKRLRPMLLLSTCEAVFGRYTVEALDFACALEMIHTYSLIHDDLPAMDNDDFRRGKPTSHKQYGEAMAILAGDALLNRAFETMAYVCRNNPSPQNLEAMLLIAAAAGDNGMIAGQADDIHYRYKKPDADTLFNIHRKKTGALFSAAFEAGALLGGADCSCIEALKQIGQKLGLAFQIFDDLMDEEATGYVLVHGRDKAQKDYTEISAWVTDKLNLIDQKTPALQAVIQEVINRKN